MTTPIEDRWRHRIGTLEGVSPDRFTISLDLDAPESTAMNTGTPRLFPRVNSYLLVPTEIGAVVGIVTELDVERKRFPKRTGLRDFDIVDLPFPQRLVRLVPVGTLRQGKSSSGDDNPVLRLDRGVHSFPSVGDPVLLPSQGQLEAIIDATGDRPGLTIGRSPIAGDAEIAVDPDRLFGRHLAVLGNTGSGKSCTIAGLIRWALEAREDASEGGEERKGPDSAQYCRFLILDPNGEYTDAFDDLADNVATYQVDPDRDGAEPLKVPAWMWNLREWTAFARATPATQRPVLQEALRQLRGGAQADDSIEGSIYSEVSGRARWLNSRVQGSLEDREEFPATKEIGQALEAALENCRRLCDSFERGGEIKEELEALISRTQEILDKHTTESGGSTYYSAWSKPDLEDLRDQNRKLMELTGDSESIGQVDPDAPIQFDVSELPSHLQLVARQQSGQSLSQWIGTLSMRIEMLLSDPRMESVIHPDDSPTISEFLEEIVGNQEEERPEVIIFDLSLVPTDIVHMMVAVLSRLVFEALQRHRQRNEEAIPTALVLEEAHTFIQRRRSEEEAGQQKPQQICRATFDRIAREGRKFGLGLVLASQRPAELSQTVLSQCNTFILHRIVNDRDQRLVSRLVPEALGDLLRDLQSLPTRQARLLGWAAPIPLLIEVSELEQAKRPSSEDPAFWKAWTQGLKTPPDWLSISDDWTGAS